MKNFLITLLVTLRILRVNDKYNGILHYQLSNYTHETFAEKKANDARMYREYLKSRMG